MALGPIIVVGCGGSGGAVVTALRNRLEKQLQRLGWQEGIPDAWQLIWADTPTEPEAMPQYGSAIPIEDYVCLSQGLPTVAEVHKTVTTFLGPQRLDQIAGWSPPPGLEVPINKGAGQWRAVGRLAAVMSLKSVANRVDEAMKKINLGTGQLDRLVAHVTQDSGQAVSQPTVFVISSLAGGTGSGIFLDICDVIRAKRPELSKLIVGILFTAEIFDNLQLPGLEYNTVGALSELMASYYTPSQGFPELYKGALTTPNVEPNRRGVSYPFIIGKRTLNGSSLSSTADVYRSVTETLSSVFLNEAVHQEFNNHIVTNWGSEQINHGVNAGYGELFNKHDGTDDVQLDGVVSSFGSSRICVGSEFFADYAAHRLTREIVTFMKDGFLTEGRRNIGDPQASAPQVLSWFREKYGIEFVSSCGLLEFDTFDKANDQILDRLIPDTALKGSKINDFIAQLHERVSNVKEQSPSQLEQVIKGVLPTVEPEFLAGIAAELDAKTRLFIEEVPAAIVAETSSYLARFGVPVALEMIRFLDEELDRASKQLQAQVQQTEEIGSNWTLLVSQVFSKLRERDKIDGRSVYAKDACKQAANSPYAKANVAVRRRAIDLIADLRRQVVLAIKLKLEQISEVLASSVGANAVAEWPESGGVPDRFRPSPLDFCLIAPDEWPSRFDALLAETVRRDDAAVFDVPEYVRRVVGGGGFRSEAFGIDRKATQLLSQKSPWTRSRPLELEASLSVDEILERAELWINRIGTPLGDFTNTKLRQFLSEVDSGGNPEPEHNDRLRRFNDALNRAIEFAQPLVHIDSTTFTSIHGKPLETSLSTRLISERLPLISGSAARSLAEGILKSHPEIYSNNAFSEEELSDFFSSGRDTESVVFVSRIKGAVHPMALASVTSPISSQWTLSTTGSDLAAGMWQFRRARPLTEFVPVRPRVLESMTRGWFTGRLVGLIEGPSGSRGPRISSGGAISDFLWPTLFQQSSRSLIADSTKQLPAVLETLAMASLLAGQTPEVMVAYSALFDLGEGSAATLLDFMRTGQCEGQISGASLVRTEAGSDSETSERRRTELLEIVAEGLDHYKANLGNTAAYGFELYPLILNQLKMIETLFIQGKSTSSRL